MLTARTNKLVHNFLSLGTVQAISSLIQLIVIPHVIGKLGIDGFGVVAVAQVVMLMLSAFTDYSFNQSAIKEISLWRNDTTVISRIFYRVLFSKLVLCIFAFLFLFALVLIVPLFRTHALLYLMAFLYVIGQSLIVNWLFQGIEKMQFIAWLTLLARTIFLVLVFVFIESRGDDWLFLFFMGTGNIIAGLVSIFIARRTLHIRYIKPEADEIRRELKEGWHVTVANLSGNFCQYANIFILRIFTNDLVVGYYGIAEKLFFTMKQVLAMFSQAIYPQICQVVLDGKENLLSYLKRIYLPFLFCVLSCCFLLFVFSPQVLSFFTGIDYSYSVFYLRMLCIAIVIICLNIPATLTLLAMDQKRKYFMIITLGMAINISFNFLLVSFFEAKGTVTAILITELFIMAGLNFQFYKSLQLQNLLKPV
jgi:polysaccharide transporter, PST family